MLPLPMRGSKRMGMAGEQAAHFPHLVRYSLIGCFHRLFSGGYSAASPLRELTKLTASGVSIDIKSHHLVLDTGLVISQH